MGNMNSITDTMPVYIIRLVVPVFEPFGVMPIQMEMVEKQ